MKINQLVDNKFIINNHDVHKICVNSKQVEENDIFVAISGSKYDGNDYVQDAIQLGAKTIITENEGSIPNVNVVVVDDCRKEVARLLKAMYADILKDMVLIGVTGTNGKTTTTTLVYKYLNYIGIKCSLIGSNGMYVDEDYYDTVNTTPDITIIYDKIIKSHEKGIKYVVMEVSSHAIKQLRVGGLDYKVVLFTNLNLDHLDYHPDFTDYQYTKGLLMAGVKEENFVMINKDSDYYTFYNHMCKAHTCSYGTIKSDYWIQNIDINEHQSSFTLTFKNQDKLIKTKMMGLFNIYNITSLIAIIDTLNLYDDRVLDFLQTDIIVPGRMEEINYDNRKIIIDFAHTPDSVFNVLTFLRQLRRKIILVIGCGGSRDKTKRAVIGDISVNNSDYVVFTSDNPRDEDEMEIIHQIIRDIEKLNFEIEPDRTKAIIRGLDISQPGDIVAILGRGNEQFQKVKGQLIPLSDAEVVKEYISRKEKEE